MFYAFLLIGLTLQLATEECTPVSGGGPETCKTCGATIGGVSYCSQCNDSGSESAPTDGKCTTDNAVCNAKAEGKCTTCTGSSFMYKGGCYSKDTKPGNAACTQAAAGVCTQAAQGYFLPPDADRDNAHQSAIPCGSEEEVPAKNNHKYKGVPHCTQCDTPDVAADANAKAATCTACESGYFVDNSKGKTCTACADNCLTCTDGTVSKCKSCTAETYFLATEGSEGPCISCGDATQGSGAWKGVAGCAKCTKPQSAGPATCTECQADKYLKTESGTASCVSAEECKDGFFPTADAQGKKVCAKCSDTANGGIEDCAKCSLKATSARAGPMVTCSGCETKRLSPLNDACLEECPAGTYPDNRDSTGICASCHNTCASCSTNAETSCTACYPGYVLSRSSGDAGTCIKECTGDFMAHCKADGCSLNVGGSKYCDQCEDGYAPVDGVCTKVASTARDASGCKASGGKCTECGANYALLSGGCYNTNKVPGNSVCTLSVGGKCTMCVASGADPKGQACPTCPDGCLKCTGNVGSQTCSVCLSGYYLSTNKCFRCTAGDGASANAITGVENCISCAPPTGGNGGSVTCYVKNDDSTGDNTGGSTNKSGLSTGAIAGIAVAAVVVVGGLVGFLCWWFIGRRKA